MAGSATGTGNIFEFNGHYYEVVNSQSEWVQNSLTAGTHQEALDAAAAMSFNGIPGHGYNY